MDPTEDWTTGNECRCHQLKPLERRRKREHQRCLAHSLVGTPNYIAPEVLLRLGYSQLCDWWSVGVILFEMLVGSPPFLANTPAETQLKVINWETSLRIPKAAHCSPEGKDLILKLCTGADWRLGKNSGEVKKHPFFQNIDFDKGLRRQVAPHIPRIQYPTDTSNFDPIDPERLRNSGSSDSNKSDELLDNGKPFHGFFEFTFRRFFDDGGGPGFSNRISLDDNDNQGPVYV
jgi:serine/threonine-protein kinase LATS1/2